MVLFLLLLTHRFLHYRFLAYGFQVHIFKWSKYWKKLCPFILLFKQVWQYYLLPEEEQRMPGVKNPMCYTFPRISKIWDAIPFSWIETITFNCLIIFNVKPPATTGDMGPGGSKKTSMPSAYWTSISSTIRWHLISLNGFQHIYGVLGVSDPVVVVLFNRSPELC